MKLWAKVEEQTRNRLEACGPQAWLVPGLAPDLARYIKRSTALRLAYVKMTWLVVLRKCGGMPLLFSGMYEPMWSPKIMA